MSWLQQIYTKRALRRRRIFLCENFGWLPSTNPKVWSDFSSSFDRQTPGIWHFDSIAWLLALSFLLHRVVILSSLDHLAAAAATTRTARQHFFHQSITSSHHCQSLVSKISWSRTPARRRVVSQHSLLGSRKQATEKPLFLPSSSKPSKSYHPRQQAKPGINLSPLPTTVSCFLFFLGRKSSGK